MLEDVEVFRTRSRSHRWLLMTAAAIVTATAVTLAMHAPSCPASAPGDAPIVRPEAGA